MGGYKNEQINETNYLLHTNGFVAKISYSKGDSTDIIIPEY